MQVNKSAKEAQKRKAKGAQNAEEPAAADVPRKWNDYTVHFEFPPPTELSTHSLMQLNDVSFQYPGREDFGLQDLNIGIDMGSRVAIVGPNGAGKTTLMNLLAGEPSFPSHCLSCSLQVAFTCCVEAAMSCLTALQIFHLLSRSRRNP